VLTLRLDVLQLGRSSLRLRIEGVCGDQTRIRCEQVRVLAALDHLRSVPIPDELRQRLQRYAAPA
jgi:4-hydroxybenzoyl-CoA thioesterase